MNNNKLLAMNLQRFAGEDITRENADSLIPIQESKEIIQGAIEASAVLSMGRRLPNMTSKQYKMPVLDMLPVAYFVNGDTGTKKLTKMAWDKKFIVAEEIAVIVPVSDAVLDDAEYDIWAEVKPRLVEAFGKVIDGAIFFNQNKPASWRNGIVPTAVAAGNVVTLGTGTDLYDDLLGEGGTISKVEEDGFFVNGHIADISMRAKFRNLRDGNGRPLFSTDMHTPTNFTLDGSTIKFPRNGAWDKSAALMVSGDFSQLVYAIRQDITFKIFDTGVIQDPSTGEIIFNLLQNDMKALRAVMRLGWEIPNPINQLNTDKETRCPFSVLKNA